MILMKWNFEGECLHMKIQYGSSNTPTKAIHYGRRLLPEPTATLDLFYMNSFMNGTSMAPCLNLELGDHFACADARLYALWF